WLRRRSSDAARLPPRPGGPALRSLRRPPGRHRVRRAGPGRRSDPPAWLPGYRTGQGGTGPAPNLIRMGLRSWSRALLALVVAMASPWSRVPAASAAGAVPVLVLDGTGWGHGVGLSQWGAEYLARTGRSVTDILGTFYPGVQLATAQGSVRVAVHTP